MGKKQPKKIYPTLSNNFSTGFSRQCCSTWWLSWWWCKCPSLRLKRRFFNFRLSLEYLTFPTDYHAWYISYWWLKRKISFVSDELCKIHFLGEEVAREKSHWIDLQPGLATIFPTSAWSWSSGDNNAARQGFPPDGKRHRSQTTSIPPGYIIASFPITIAGVIIVIVIFFIFDINITYIITQSIATDILLLNYIILIITVHQCHHRKQVNRQSFTVHSGTDASGDLLFLEVILISVILCKEIKCFHLVSNSSKL